MSTNKFNDGSLPITTITVKPSKKDNLRYGKPIIVHESSRTQIEVVPFFILRTNRTELRIKIVSHNKRTSPQSWEVDGARSVSLDAEATRKLWKALGEHLEIAKQSALGQYVVIGLADGNVVLNGNQPAEVAKALVQVLSRADIAKFVASKDLGSELVSALRGAIRIQELRTALAELRMHLDAGEAREQVYQQWCQRHGWAFGTSYLNPEEVRRISAGDDVDILVRSTLSGYCDIIELKRPDVEVLGYDKGHKNFYFSRDVNVAMGQCHRYLDVLQEQAAHGLMDHPHLLAYHPRATVVLGRSVNWTNEMTRALHGLNSRLNGITVMTYDHLLLQGQWLVDRLVEEEQACGESENDEGALSESDPWKDTMDFDGPF